MESNNYFVGTELKFKLAITCEGFNMDNDQWTATVTSRKGKVICTKEQNTSKVGDDWFILVDSSILGAGQYYLTIEIKVQDADFSDGLRTEVYKQPLVNVLKV